MTLAKNFGRACISPPMTTDRPAYTLGSCVAMKQKSSIRGRPTCSTMKFRSGKSVAQWSTSETSNASLSSGQIVGPLCTWMFLIPSSWAASRNRYAAGSLQLVAARAVVPLGGVELDALGPVALDVLPASCLQALVAVAGIEPGVGDELAGVLRAQRRVALGGVEALLVPLLQVGRLEDRHVDVPVLEDVLHQVVLGVLLEVLDAPVRLRRARAPGRRGSTRSSPWRTSRRPAPSCPEPRSSSAYGYRQRSTSRRPFRTRMPPRGAEALTR